MINGEAIERAEKTLEVVYQSNRAERQMDLMRVDLDAFNKFLEARKGTVKTRYLQAWNEMDPRMEPAMNTLMMHMFLVGLICGRNSIREAQ